MAAYNRPGTCTERSPGPRQVFQMARISGGGRGASIQQRRLGNRPLFGQLLNLYVHRQGHNTTGRRLRQIDLVCSQGCPQGPGRCARCLGSSAGGTGRRSSIKGGVIGLFFPATFIPPCSSPRAHHDGAAAASNRPGTCAGWSLGLRQVCQMPPTFDDGHGASIQHKRRGNWSLF